MSSPAGMTSSAERSKVLVVDDDRRVRELLEVALTTHGFDVLTASDGDEALLRAHRDRPDLIVLDIRLPKRSGLEVCDSLRNDPTDPHVPIVLISAVSEGDQRVLGFARGADDFLSKPFSPKELAARVRRLLVRTSEMRTALRRARDLDRELASARREASRADEDARREYELRGAATGAGRELVDTLELRGLLDRILAMVHVRTRTPMSVILLPSARIGGVGADGFEACRSRGELPSRPNSVTLPRDREFEALLAGMGRPITVPALERMGEFERHLSRLIAGRWGLVIPLVSTTGLEGIVVAREPDDHSGWSRADLEWLAVFGGFAASAVRKALDVRAQAGTLLRLLGEQTYRSEAAREAVAETRELLDRWASAFAIDSLERETLAHALNLSDWNAAEGGVRPALQTMSANDPSGLVGEVASVLDTTRRGETDANSVRSILRALVAYTKARARGASKARSLDRAASASGGSELGERLRSSALESGPVSEPMEGASGLS